MLDCLFGYLCIDVYIYIYISQLENFLLYAILSLVQVFSN